MSVLVGRQAPGFTATAVVKDEFKTISLSDYIGKKYVIFFFYPLDFTFVCPTELHAFQEQLEEFHKRNAEVIGCSIDSHYSHFAWLSMPKEKGGVCGVSYPLVSDLHREIAKSYDVLSEEGVALRGLFLIDKTGIVRHQVVNDLPLGRSVNEALRLLDALQYYEEHGEVCPANWTKGRPALAPTQKGVSDYLSSKSKAGQT